jgi:dihydrofolate reductase
MKAIAAMARNRVIGKDGQIPWHLPEDFKWFKSVTLGHAILMGRRTWDSLGRPLPGRLNLVATRDPSAAAPDGAELVRDLAAFDPAAYLPRDVWVIGGAELYRQLLPRCDELLLTLVHREPEGETAMPPFEHLFPLRETLRATPEFDVLRFYKV